MTFPRNIAVYKECRAVVSESKARHDMKNYPPLNNPVKGVHRFSAVTALRRVRGLASVIGVLAPRALITPFPSLLTVSHADLISVCFGFHFALHAEAGATLLLLNLFKVQSKKILLYIKTTNWNS